MSHTPTDEQQAIYTTARTGEDHIMIQAYAGCAKTTTLEGIAHAVNPGINALALAFNSRTKEELTKRFPQNFSTRTLNGLGHAAWGKAIEPRLQIVEGKLARICRELVRETNTKASDDEMGELRSMVTFAMQNGIVHSDWPHKGLLPDTRDSWLDVADKHMIDISETMLQLAREALRRSTASAFAGQISFDDQIYMSALFGGVFPKFPLVFVDEAQDLSPLNHIQLRRTAAARLIVVGDSRQAIYAFRGADSDSMNTLRRLRTSWTDQPLTLTFRCPKVIVERQQHHAPGFRAAPGNPEGHFGVLSTRLPAAPQPGLQDTDQGLLDASALSDSPWKWSDITALAPPGPSPIAVLCRNNAPLLKLAFALIRQGQGVTMLGRDIGASLGALSKKLFPEDSTPLSKCLGAIVEWRNREAQSAIAECKEGKASVIEDRAESLMAVAGAEGIRDAGDIRNALFAIFSPKVAKVTLSSIHKAKGLEWPLVLHLDPWRLPSRQARKAGGVSLQQELNLKYVLETRSQGILLEANLGGFA